MLPYITKQTVADLFYEETNKTNLLKNKCCVINLKEKIIQLPLSLLKCIFGERRQKVVACILNTVLRCKRVTGQEFRLCS